MLATATEELAKEFNSMELKHLFKSGRGGLPGASGDMAACLAAAAASQPLSGTELGLGMAKPAKAGAGSLDSTMVGASITSDDMNILLHAGASPLLNVRASPSAPARPAPARPALGISPQAPNARQARPLLWPAVRWC